ncbi:MAG: hypothetical protein HFI21_07515 [Lachnospiraceae bacterium]|nr:hypothetical protein [Lachnospiraceae bacterium]
MKKKIVMAGLVIAASIIMTLFFIGGLEKRTDVVLKNYSISEDGEKMKLNIAISSSAGYTRALEIKQGGDNKYITFYSTFGFLNSDFGAKSEYEIELNPSCTEIYFYKGGGEYKLVLQKNEAANEWEHVKNGF